jgi:hypothetical protein
MFCAAWRAVAAITSTAAGALGPVGGKAQRLHPAHRAADDGVQPLDPQRIEQGDCARTMSRMVMTGKRMA